MMNEIMIRKVGVNWPRKMNVIKWKKKPKESDKKSDNKCINMTSKHP